ncbi:hypothetical protein [Thalassospira sp. TSL5-1]|uniref:hypothetical protein n=1 Tax=Thalassospira sp. TSL5-1 TaxID=1544451 RepID=UPI00093E8B8B|nr:hypothetical protein [Thalassospira sp. TSL5-1]OKH89829.1 hypothetical protein LF95_07960 [Thalassospira sp. TSL5-1]
MSENPLRKTYTIMVTRTTGHQMELETVQEYGAAMESAKKALDNTNNTEIRIVENKYDDATRKEKKQVIKILNRDNLASATTGAVRAGKGSGTLAPEVMSRMTKSIINISLAVTVLILLGGIMFQILNQ